MASRKEQKERLRQERLVREREQAQAERRRRMLRYGWGGLLGGALVAAVVVAVVAGGGTGDKGGKAFGTFPPAVPLPAQKNRDLATAAQAAGCQLRNFPDYGAGHTTNDVKYRSNPPTSGAHYPVPAEDGSYAPAESPPVTHTVHSLEHGRVDIQWRAGLSRRQLGQLKSLFNEGGGYHALLFQNRTDMPYAVAATAWTHLIGCPRFSDGVFDALRAFRATYTDKAPERVP